jgi:hypothetical protein
LKSGWGAAAMALAAAARERLKVRRVIVFQ